MIDDEIPVIVGVGRTTQRERFPDAKSPVQLASHAVRLSAEDAAGPAMAEQLLQDVVAIGSVGMFFETRWIGHFKKKPFVNFSRLVASAIGAKPGDEWCWRSYPGGNGPQHLVNLYAEKIATAAIPQGPIVICGAEANASFDDAVRNGKIDRLVPAGWGPCEPSDVIRPVVVNRQARSSDEHTKKALFSCVAHGVMTPILSYPMFENAYSKKLGRTLEQHNVALSELMSRFSVVSASHPEHSWFPNEYTPKQVSTVSDSNRMISYPYTKRMVARDEVDQAAAVLMMSFGEARRRGISRDKLVFLWGSGDCYDTEMTPLRLQIDDSSSMKAAYDEAFLSAGIGSAGADSGKIAAMDIYSCFPIAVELGCKCLNLSPTEIESTRITVTGGLAYHGGPGSNYSCHALCALVEKLRSWHYRGKLGMIAANGGNLTEHSVGIYSTASPKHRYKRRDPLQYAPQCGLKSSDFALNPNGYGKILAWTVEFDKKPNIPKRGIIIGEMVTGTDLGKRFCANTEGKDRKTLSWMLKECRIGERVTVASTNKIENFGLVSASRVVFSKEQSML